MVRVIVTVDDVHVGAIDELARVLQDHGMTIDQVLAVTGQISGSIAEDRVSGVAALDGVVAVDTEARYQLPPPDAEIQ